MKVRKWTPEKAIMRSPAFWITLALAVAVLFLGVFAASNAPQAGGVLMAVAFCGVVLAAIVAAMVAIRTNRPSDQQLRESR